ncbi:sensor histidine kinase [Lapillicoccus jejuensis]|uniref:sensor histidine kinase n=1 Tax=Lapillicoccus jejuensis TaxID=402171 RepID=UPI001B86F9C6|nr:ATP-binding protein [Lapillicoccus jejuensis]
MTPAVAAIGGVLVGIAVTLLVVLADRDRRRRESLRMEGTSTALPDGVGDVLAVLRSSGVVVDASDAVETYSPSAESSGLVRGGELAHPELLEMARAVRRDHRIREAELELRRGPLGEPSFVVHARVAPLGAAHVLLLVEDRTQARRVEEVRRDFVANVSHELKTPVGGLALLSEAVLDAHDDPEAVARFARRMQVESTRLTRLVKEIVDLSRLQAADTLTDPQLVDLVPVAREAVDAVRVTAEDKRIALVVVSDCGDHQVWGDHDLLVTAVRNLVGNAVAYSESGTRVTVRVAAGDDLVTVAVTDQGLGIPAAERERIFERFYRVDGARSRQTGGTGLGLAIVKHVSSNHGGDVAVWSEPGQGSTFTVRLPAAIGGRAPEPSASSETPADPDHPEPPPAATHPARSVVAAPTTEVP